MQLFFAWTLKDYMLASEELYTTSMNDLQYS